MAASHEPGVTDTFRATSAFSEPGSGRRLRPVKADRLRGLVAEERLSGLTN